MVKPTASPTHSGMAECIVILQELIKIEDVAGSTKRARNENFYDRLCAESRELDDRIEKLAAFMNNLLYRILDPIEQDLLRQQRSAMEEYADILGQRIVSTKIPDMGKAEQIDRGVTLIGGDQRESPIPFE